MAVGLRLGRVEADHLVIAGQPVLLVELVELLTDEFPFSYGDHERHCARRGSDAGQTRVRRGPPVRRRRPKRVWSGDENMCSP